MKLGRKDDLINVKTTATTLRKVLPFTTFETSCFADIHRNEQWDSEVSIKDGLNFKDTRQNVSEHPSYGPPKKKKSSQLLE